MSGLEEELIDRIMGLLGTPTAVEGTLTEQDVDAMKRIAGVLDAGFPLVALLQLVRVYAQSIRKIAEAEVRLFHLFVHEPLIAEGVDALQMAEEMEGLATRPLPVGRAAHVVHPQPLPALLHRAGRRRPHGDRARRLAPARPGDDGVLLRRPHRASPGSPRRRATRRHSTWSSDSSTPSRQRCPPRRSWSRRSATR